MGQRSGLAWLYPGSGRQAKPAPVGWNLFKTSVQIVGFWGTFLAVLPTFVTQVEASWGMPLGSFASPLASTLGEFLFVVCSLLGLSSAFVMVVYGRGTPLPVDCPQQLVVRGPYRLIRNPMVVAGIGQGVAVSLGTGSPAVLVYSLLGAGFWQIIVRPWEEMDLERRFGASYLHYRDSVRCWLPTARYPIPNVVDLVSPPLRAD